MRARFFLPGLLPLLILCFPKVVYAEDCTGTLPGADCTLDEDTTAPLTIDNAVTLTVGGSIQIDETVDGSVPNVGTINTGGTGITIDQTAEIGGTAPIDSLSVGDGDTWNASANIITNNDGVDANNGAVQGDIDLGTVDGGEVLNLNSGISVRAQIDGNTGDSLNVGADTNGGEFLIVGTVNSIALSVDSGELTTQSSLGGLTALSSLSVGAGATLNLSGASNVVEVLDLDGTLGIEAGNRLTVNTYNANANSGTVTLGLDRDGGSTSSGVLSFVGGGPADLSGATLTLNIEQNSEVLVSETLGGVIQGNGGATVLPVLIDSSFLYDFSLAQNGNDVDLVIVRNSVTGSSSTENNADVASLLLVDLAGTEDGDILAVQNNLAKASTSEEYNETLESVQPTQDSGPTIASGFVTDKTVDLALRRLMYLRNGGRITGVSSGDEYDDFDEMGGRAWLQVFGSTGEQSARDGIDGYDIGASGVSVGYDTGDMNEKVVMGLSGTYADTRIDSDNANSTKSEIISYQIGLYGTYNTDNEFFINGAVIWGINDVTRTRKNVGGTGNAARSEYDSEQITIYSDVGADYKRGILILTPSIGAQYSYLETENYRERGAGGLNLSVNEDSVHTLEVGPKLNLKWEKKTRNGLYVIPEVSAGYTYDVIGDRSESIAVLEGGGGQLRLEGFEPQRHTINVGTGLSVADDFWEVKANYDYEHQGDLDVHSASLRGVYKF